ncbi:MAG: hypothetical protein QM503_03265 [Bacteroidota bacterium]
MNKKDTNIYDVFNKLELVNDFQPLIYLCDSGVGMFSKSAMVMLIKADLDNKSHIMLSFIGSSFFDQVIESADDIVIKLGVYKGKFFFEYSDLTKKLGNISPKRSNGIGYYSGSINVEHTKVNHSNEIITKWNISDIESFTNKIEFYKTHALAQKERHEKNRDELLNFLDTDINFYNECLFNSAYVYLEETIKLDQLSIKILSTNSQFWNWWKVQYYIMDEKIMFDYYVSKDIHLQDVSFLRSFYFHRHKTPQVQLENYLYHYLIDEKAKIRNKTKIKAELC